MKEQGLVEELSADGSDGSQCSGAEEEKAAWLGDRGCLDVGDDEVVVVVVKIPVVEILHAQVYPIWEIDSVDGCSSEGGAVGVIDSVVAVGGIGGEGEVAVGVEELKDKIVTGVDGTEVGSSADGGRVVVEVPVAGGVGCGIDHAYKVGVGCVGRIEISGDIARGYCGEIVLGDDGADVSIRNGVGGRDERACR